jgi:hypothetical protein
MGLVGRTLCSPRTKIGIKPMSKTNVGAKICQKKPKLDDHTPKKNQDFRREHPFDLLTLVFYGNFRPQWGQDMSLVSKFHNPVINLLSWETRQQGDSQVRCAR